MDTLVERLEGAMEHAGTHVKRLCVALGRRGTRGSSYPNVTAYLRGVREPSLAWVRDAADELGVRAEWLGFGHGAMTAHA